MLSPSNFAHDMKTIFTEMSRILKDDGEIITSLYNEDAFEERMKLYT